MFKKKSLFSLLLKYKYSFLIGVLSLSVVDMAQLAIPKVIQWAIDALTTDTITQSQITRYALYILGLGLFMAIFRLGWRYFIMGAARKIENTLRNEFFDHLQSLNFDFFSSKKIGDLMAHTVNDIETLKFSCGLGVLIAYDGIFLFFFIFGAMYFISPELTLYAFIPFPFLALFMYKFGNMFERRFQKTQDSFSELTESARQSISGIKVVKAFNREEAELHDFEKSSIDYLDRNIHLIRIWGIYLPMITLVIGIASAIFLLFGGINTINFELSLGKFTALLVYMAMLAWPMMAMGWAVDIMKRGNASINRLNNIFKIEPEIEDDDSTRDIPLNGELKFQNLSFSFNGSEVLSNINLDIPIGTSLGITGTTGSGKTTLINLLMKMHNVNNDQIFLDKIDIKSVSKKSLLETITYVPQNTTIFSGTVVDNITFMNPNLTEHEIIEAAKIAEIYDDIKEFPDGFNTIIGERGLSLSGGQRQRLSIARAILLNPKILILDDVLSSLDFETERNVLRNIKKTMEGKTLIAISSRVPSISNFDKIAVFEKGKIIEYGNHLELINSEGLYSAMYKVQTI